MLTELRFARIAGIDIAAHPSLPIVFTLICVSLGGGILPMWHPEWPPALTWAVALATGLLFIVSVLAHELAHALTGLAAGVPVRRITLFMFGGVARLGKAPPNWRVDLLSALAAPLTTLAIVLLCMWVSTQAVGRVPVQTSSPEHAYFLVGPTGTIFLWLGQINLGLLLFNLLPGFPLDAGRLLRALLWGISGNLRSATRWASRAGQAFAWMFIAAGLLLILGPPAILFGTGPFIGLWLVVTGVFLNTAARLGYRQAADSGSLDGVPVERVMHSEFATASPDMTIGELVDDYVLPGVQHTFPVLEDGKFAGLVALHDLSKVPRAAWPEVQVREVMTPAIGVAGVAPKSSAAEAMVALGRQRVDQIPVIENGKLRGLVSREDILRRLSLYGDPALAQ